MRAKMPAAAAAEFLRIITAFIFFQTLLVTWILLGKYPLSVVDKSRYRSGRRDLPAPLCAVSSQTYTTDEADKGNTCTGARLCVNTFAGLGNQMFQYASAYGISKLKNMDFEAANSSIIYRYFSVPATTLRTSKCSSDTVAIHKDCAYSQSSLNFTTNRSRSLIGYMQSWKYFSHVENELRQHFVFKEHILNRVDAFIRATISRYSEIFRSGNITLVGIHIRRGDLLSKKAISYGYNVAPKSYLENAIIFFRSIFKNIVFVVASTDIKWARRHLGDGQTEYLRGNSAEIDMATLSKCNHTIITVGTFGWWSAWLARGMTVYYKNPVRPESKLREQFSGDMSDYFLPGWIPIE